jgi:hypothetical protein
MTILELAKKLPPPIGRRLIDNIHREGCKSTLKKLIENGDCGDCQNIIGGTFHWSSTPEGHDYWSEIYYNLGDLNDSHRIR